VALQICSLADGEDYHAANPAWIPRRPDRPRRGRPPLPPQPPATISKFRVRQHLHNGRHYWSPYDLLGLFMSFMGPAPDGATKRNFYLPMTAVYGRWCRQIAGHRLIQGRPSGGVGKLPTLFQCTWRKSSGKPTRFFLGSSMAGHSSEPLVTGTWQTVLKHARFDLIGARLQQEGYSFDDSPLRRPEQRGDLGTRFGNCGETYPFLDLLVYVLCFFLCHIHC
jgi:hypothetical protein